MAGLINLPGYNPGPGINFQPIQNALSQVNESAQFNRQNALAQEQMGMQRQQLGMQTEKHGLQMAGMKREQEVAEARQVAGRVQYIQGLPPEQQGQAWQQTLQMPGFKDLPPELRDFNRAAPVLLSKAAEYYGEKDRAQIGMIGAQTQKFLAEAEKDRREAAGGGKASLVPVWGKDAQGNDVLLQTRPDGSAVQTRMPPGVSPVGKTSKVDLGTHFGVMDAGGNLIGRIPKDIEGKEAAERRGQGQGQAQVDLPKVKQSAASTLRYVDEVLKDPNLGNVTGWQARLPTLKAASIDTEERISQLGGRAFLEAFQGLKGGGAITEIEGQKATAALGRLTNLKQSDKGFRTALQDFRNEVMDLVRLAEQKARGGGAYVPPPGVPTDGVPRENTDRLPPSPPGWSIKRID